VTCGFSVSQRPTPTVIAGLRRNRFVSRSVANGSASIRSAAIWERSNATPSRPSRRPTWTTDTSGGIVSSASALSSPATIIQLPGTWRGSHATWLHRSTLSRSST
jgi:hypothetical protein